MPAAPVYLWGPAGSGKTHLLRALAAQRQAAGERVGWFDAADAAALGAARRLGAGRASTAATRSTPTPSRPPSRSSSRPPTHGVQMAAAGRLPPVDLPLRDDLRTRLAWGHVFALQPLAEAETRAALRREADRRGIFLSDEVMDYLLTRFDARPGAPDAAARPAGPLRAGAAARRDGAAAATDAAGGRRRAPGRDS